MKFLDEVADKPISYYAFEVLYWCGIREGELLALTKCDFDFQKHSLIIGASGTGKSKFFCSFLHGIFHSDNQNQYKFLVIDPHVSLVEDIGGLDHTKVIDFFSSKQSIQLMKGRKEDYICNTELYLSLFQSLLKDQYNSKLERVLRYSLQLMLCVSCFSFEVFRKLLLDTSFRLNLLQKYRFELNDCILNFFYQDYPELKTTSYGEAIAPILSFLDEMEMSPAFQEKEELEGLEDVLKNHFLTLISLDRKKLGDHVSKMIAGFVMCQFFNIASSRNLPEHIFLVIDEVAVLENPVLERFLSEARKFGVSVILISQFFHQVSPSLQETILANVVNYYVFRIGTFDAELLVNQLAMNLGEKDSIEKQISMLTSLKEREGIIRVSQKGKLLKGMQIKTLDFTSIPFVPGSEFNLQEKRNASFQDHDFSFSSSTSLSEILKITSSSHRKVNRL